MDTTIDTVLVAVGADPDEELGKVIEATVQLAVPTGATVVLAHVFTPDEFAAAAERLEYSDATVEDADAVLRRHRRVREFVDALNEHGVRSDVRGAVGEVTDELVAMATELDAERVIVAGHRRSPTGKAVFGSLSQELLLEAPCPVTYVKTR